MEPEQRAEIEEQIAAIEEATERCMYASALLVGDGERIHRRADAISKRVRASFGSAAMSTSADAA
jgi:hypothetical protein